MLLPADLHLTAHHFGAGRALAALVDSASEEDLDKISGKVIHSVELAQRYGTIDPDSNPAPLGPFSSAEAVAGVRADGPHCRLRFGFTFGFPTLSRISSLRG